MSKETEILHRISQARNKHNAPGTDELLKDCDIFIKEYGDLVDSHCTKNIDELHTQIADMATKLTVAEDELDSIKVTSLILPPGVKREDAMKIINASKPKRTRRTKKQMEKARQAVVC